MYDSIGSILSDSEIYYDLHHNIIKTLFDGLKNFNSALRGLSIIKMTFDESHNPPMTSNSM